MPGRSTSSENTPYKYTGHERDEESGINIDYMLARGYDPAVARFLQIDPLAKEFAGWTPYHYVHNNPLNLTDPTGMAAEEAGDCPTCLQVLRKAFSWLQPVWDRKGQELEQKSQEVKQEVKQEIAETTETVVKEGPEILSDASEASAIMLAGAATVSLATGIGPDDAILAPAASGLAIASTITDGAATTLKLADALFYGGDMNEAVQDVVRTTTSIAMAGAYGGIVSNVAKPKNQQSLRQLIKAIMPGF